MGQPAIPIDVEAETGIWRTDGLPMVYLPRHFLVNNHLAVEEALGRNAYRRILRVATDKSAVHWCRAESTKHNLTVEETFKHYLKRLSQRGWGQFSIQELDIKRKRGSVDLRNSVFTLECKGSAPHSVCYMFEGFMTGALRFVASGGDDLVIHGAEVSCQAQGHDECRFDFNVV